jgi:hypothetical protein
VLRLHLLLPLLQGRAGVRVVCHVPGNATTGEKGAVPARSVRFLY